MPRHTHPRVAAKHGRAHVRLHRDRYIARRWRAAKRRITNWPIDRHPEEIRHMRLGGVWWPFDLERGRFARNPFTTCSCDACGVPAWERRADRRLGEREWRRDWRDALG